MKQIFYIIALIICSLSYGQSFAPESTKVDKTYTFKAGDLNGTGKWYMNREIARVMGYQSVDWLERSKRDEEENTKILIKNMNIKESDVIADIGAGSGYHVFKMAPLVSKGMIYAVDIQKEMLEAMAFRIEDNDIKNVVLVEGTEHSVNLKPNSVDKILLVDVYNEFDFPKEMIVSIKKALKKDGELYLIEYRGEDDAVPIKKVYKMTEEQAVKEFKIAGFKLRENISNLPWQHCMIFVKK